MRPCPFAVDVGMGDKIFCRNPTVRAARNLVPPAVCASCQLRDIIAAPRPVASPIPRPAPKQRGLGDTIERALRAAGITPERWQWYRDQLLGYVGIEPPKGCGCKRRRRWLNRLGERIQSLLQRQT